MERFYTKTIPEPNTGCLLWTAGADVHGYGYFTAEGKSWRAHRFAWFLEHGYDCELHVLHKCDTTSCVNPEHLYAGTHDDNMRDRAQRGRLVGKTTGERNSQARLTWADVHAIRASDELQRVLAKRYGIAQGMISRIKSGKAWKTTG